MVPTTKAVARWAKDCIDAQSAVAKGDFVALNKAGQDASLAWFEIWGITPGGVEAFIESMHPKHLLERHHTPV